MDTPNTAFAQMIANNPMSARSEEVLAASLASIATHDRATVTLAARQFIERFCPRNETSIEALAEAGVRGRAIEQMPTEQRTLCLTSAFVLAMMEADGALPFARLDALAAAFELDAKAVAHAERVAREHVIEQTFRGLYAAGKPSEKERSRAYERLRLLGATDSMLLRWEREMMATERPEDGPGATAFGKVRRDAFMRRHDPDSDAHRASSSVGVFGAS